MKIIAHARQAGKTEAVRDLISAGPPIPCDYCDAHAIRFIDAIGESRNERRFTCEEHRERAYRRDAPLPGRSRFFCADYDMVVDFWRRRWRAAHPERVSRGADGRFFSHRGGR